MKELLLSNQSKYALIDDEDYDIVNLFKWCVNAMGYAQTASYPFVKKIEIKMHRLIISQLTLTRTANSNELSGHREF